jgi:hypothetical protein
MNADELKAHLRRLAHLRVRAALQGINTPPEVLIEIEDIESKISNINKEVVEPQNSSLYRGCINKTIRFGERTNLRSIK